MVVVRGFEGREVAVFGLGRSGLAGARALAAGRAVVWAWDDDARAREAARAQGIFLHDLYRCDWRRPSLVMWSPGIPHTYPRPHPLAERARAAGCEIVCDVDLLARSLPKAAYIGITGTNGKSTTTALVGHILARAGRRCAVGGNLGPAVLALQPLGEDGTYVIEMSSYQLELAPHVTFDVAVLLNVTPDHLERHGGMVGYEAAKRMIFRTQMASCTAVVGVDDERSRAVFVSLQAEARRRVIPISGYRHVARGVFVAGGLLLDATAGPPSPVLDMAEAPALPGAHNGQNAAAAYAAARAAGVAPAEIAAAIRTYPGLAHRQELVAVVDGIAYVNDSKATNAESAARALASYPVIYWIAGGLPKEGGIEATIVHLGSVRRAFLIGTAAPEFNARLAGRIATTLCGDLATAVAEARIHALADGIPEAVVLLSPACASFDQFANFEARGEAFRALVEKLPGRRTEPRGRGQIPPGGEPRNRERGP